MSLQANKRQWDELGRLDPFWAMTGTNRFNSWNVDAFFQTGVEQVDHLIRQIAPYERPQQWSTILDFGCGVGRLARAFRRHFEQYAGIDISESLVFEARRLHASLSQAHFIVSASATLPIASNSCDMVYAWGVLQHVPDRTSALRYVGEFVRVMRPGGMLAFTTLNALLPLYRLQPRRRIYAILRTAGVSPEVLYRHLKLYPHEVHPLPGNEVVAQLDAAGAQILNICDESPPDAPHQWRTYYVTK